jgi:hypothetical protein
MPDVLKPDGAHGQVVDRCAHPPPAVADYWSASLVAECHVNQPQGNCNRKYGRFLIGRKSSFWVKILK